jgi:hypothetical protein
LVAREVTKFIQLVFAGARAPAISPSQELGASFPHKGSLEIAEFCSAVNYFSVGSKPPSLWPNKDRKLLHEQMNTA